MIVLIFLDLYIFLLSKIWIELIFGANFSESVGPNKTIIGILASPIICITPLSIDIAKFNLEANAVTRAGHAIFEWCSGNKALGNLDLERPLVFTWKSYESSVLRFDTPIIIPKWIQDELLGYLNEQEIMARPI